MWFSILESGRGNLYLHNIKDGNEERAPNPCILSRELSQTEELQLKQDQDLKEEEQKKQYIFF